MLPLQNPLAVSLFFILLSIASYGFLKDVSGVPSNWMPNDKVMHHLIFLGLMLLWQVSYPGKLLLGVLSLVVYGGAVEIAQATFTNRMGDWWDWAADNSGIFLAIILWRVVFARYLVNGSAKPL